MYFQQMIRIWGVSTCLHMRSHCSIRYHCIPPSDYADYAVKEHVQQLLESQVESSSPFASPIVVVKKKKDGRMRLCVAHWQLNQRTMKDTLPLPRFEETLDALSEAQWFSTVELVSGYTKSYLI